MANLRQSIAASESLRSKFLHGKPFSEEDVRMELAPSADLRKQLDEAMQLVLALTAANERFRLALQYTNRMIQQLPSGIDCEADEDDPSPEDASAHIGGLIFQKVGMALKGRD